MYACRSCGADLRFDIELQMLKCDHCEQTVSVYEMVKEQDGVQDRVELNLFECPQCGGELLSDDTSITQYCSFCGGMTVLSSRIAKEKMPEEIIPFQITKQACHEAYRKHMKKMFYAPKAFRECQGEQDFRAIYIPYWKYRATQRGAIHFEAFKKHKEEKDVIRYKADLDVEYDNIIFDASSSFADELGDAIAPFDAGQLQKFTPSYLCGFYADTADVPTSVYQEEAKQAAEEKTAEYLQGRLQKQDAGYELDREKKFVTTYSSEGSRMMLPAWFLAYRKGNRVAYATVNGQTGKVEADLPIDLLKFGVATAAIAVLLFLGLNLFFTMKPQNAMAITGALLAVIAKFYSDEMRATFYRDNKIMDRGFAYRFQDLHKFAKMEEKLIRDSENKAKELVKNFFAVLGAIIMVLLYIQFMLVILLVVYILYFAFSHIGIYVVLIASSLTTLFYLYESHLYIRRTASLKGTGAVCSLIAVILSVIVAILNPVSDLYYYVGIFAILLAVLASALDLIHSHNVAATQPLPEFLRNRGGQENE